MKLIVGLGNPGEQYRCSRHNLGFLSLDYLAERHKFSSFKQSFDALFCKGKIGPEAAILAKPQTYMNLSGISIEKLTAYFKVAIGDIVVIHDDLDLPYQTIRMKDGGGFGGHKGLISIAEHLGSSDFLRVRIGIGKPARKTMIEGYVLSPFSDEEIKTLTRVIVAAGEAAEQILRSGIQAAMRSYHGKTVNKPENAAIK